MKLPHRQANWSFLLMRGAEHSVKQFTVKKRSLVAAPIAFIAIITGCFIGMKLQAASHIQELEHKLAQLNHNYEQANLTYSDNLIGHQVIISDLESKLENAYFKQQQIDKKLIELQELEKQLEQFMANYGSESTIELDRTTKQTKQITERISIPDSDLPNTYRVTQLSYSTANSSITPEIPAIHELEIDQLSKVVDNFIEVMHYNLHKAGNIKKEVDSFPNYWPTTTMMTTSGFGYRRDPFSNNVRFHAGIDIDGNQGDVILSAGDGIVVEASYHDSYGYYVIIEHTTTLKTLYSHLKTIEAKVGDSVVKGEKIGKMGSTGRSTGTHLHFQVMLNNQPVSPLKFIIKRE